MATNTISGGKLQNRSSYGAKEYYAKIARPLCARYTSDGGFPIDVLAAAIVMVWHTIDWIASEQGTLPRDEMKKQKSTNPQLEYLHAAANTFKHREISSSPAEHVGLKDILHESVTATLRINGREVSKATLEAKLEYSDGTLMLGSDLVILAQDYFDRLFGLK